MGTSLYTGETLPALRGQVLDMSMGWQWFWTRLLSPLQVQYTGGWYDGSADAPTYKLSPALFLKKENKRITFYLWKFNLF